MGLQSLIEQTKTLNKKIFSVAPGLSVISKTTEKLLPYLYEHHMEFYKTPMEMHLLDQYEKEAQLIAQKLEASKYKEKFYKNWEKTKETIALQMQDELLRNNLFRLEYHLEDLYQAYRFILKQLEVENKKNFDSLFLSDSKFILKECGSCGEKDVLFNHIDKQRSKIITFFQKEVKIKLIGICCNLRLNPLKQHILLIPKAKEEKTNETK